MLEEYDWDFQFKEPEDECLWSNKKFRMFYPCILFVQRRISMAKSYGFGVSVWDGGQGPHYFYYLFKN